WKFHCFFFLPPILKAFTINGSSTAPRRSVSQYHARRRRRPASPRGWRLRRGTRGWPTSRTCGPSAPPPPSSPSIRFSSPLPSSPLLYRVSEPSTLTRLGSGCPQEEGGRRAVVLDATVFHPQGGGQPADTGVIVSASGGARFLVEDVRVKDGVVFHYGRFEDAAAGDGCGAEFTKGQSVTLEVDAERRKLNSRLHSAGHLLDSCMTNLGLHLEPGKGYHFPDGPSVEYKGVVPADQLQDKKIQLEKEANELILKGSKVLVSVFPYEEAAKLCGGALPSYISQDSTPRIVKFGDYPGCPCGGTHVADIADIGNLKV
uniref:Alanyl-transfer RNA synthetases family profile domain-containing protein n=1 Tax=Aegilops tauschii subsp. strangulata TaxID=200361 RepID=A0A453DR60_AEGTS